MKIRSGHITGSQQGGTSKTAKANGRFQALLDHELESVAEADPDITVQPRDAREQPYQLLSDATQLLTDVIAQIESGDTPQDQTLASLQQLRNELVNLGNSDSTLNDAQVIISVEAERLQSW